MILFLDFDGVLHPSVCADRTQLLCRRPMLEDTLRHVRHVEIVISSTWRSGRSLSELRALFSDDIALRIVGVTPDWRTLQDEKSFGTYVRQAEIEAWLRQNRSAWSQWVAVDDQPHLYKPFLKNLLLTDPKVGLSEETCAALHGRLAGGEEGCTL